MTRLKKAIPWAALAALLCSPVVIASCGDASKGEDIGNQQQNLNGCNLSAVCTTPGQFCYSHQTPDSGILVCNTADPQNKYYDTTCAAGYYCEAGLYDWCTDGNMQQLRCDMTLNVLVDAMCGDGVLDPGEVCDELGTQNESDCTGTCNATCTIALTGCGDGITCGTEQCDDGDHVSNDGCDDNCHLTGCGNGVVTVGEGCDDGNLTNGDGCDNNCQPTGCGNGMISGTEMCDDGNNINGDGCDNDCTLSTCGNGVLTDGEQCDDGNNISGDGCQANCKLPMCGDDVVDAGEECDDGMANSNMGACTQMCTIAECGDGYVQMGVEECDDGNANYGDDCDPDCTLPYCGDGYMDPNEACDDGNNTNGDGCDANCALEPDCVEQNPVPCEPNAYGCLQSPNNSPSYCLYDADGPGGMAGVVLECQCANAADNNKGSWMLPGSNCNTACQNSGSGGAGGAGATTTVTTGTTTTAATTTTTTTGSGAGGAGGASTSSGGPGCAMDGADCNVDGDCCSDSCLPVGPDGINVCATIGLNILMFSWTEPASYNQPTAGVTVQGAINGGSWGTLCTMTESAPDSHYWTCSAPVASGSSLIFNMAHTDPGSLPSGTCWVFDQCDKFCSGDNIPGNKPDTGAPGFDGETDGVNFGSFVVANLGGPVSYTQADNGVDALACTQNGVIASVP